MNSDEIICSCLGITKGMIKEAVDQGASTLAEVQEINSVGTVCGTCVEDVEQLIDELLPESTRPRQDGSGGN